MLKSFRYLVAVLLLVSFAPLRSVGQTADDKADKAERAHRKAVIKHRYHKIRHGAAKGYHKVVSTVLSPVDKAVAKHKADEKSEGETH